MLSLLLCLFIRSLSSSSINYELLINTNDVLQTIPSPYIGFTIDWWKSDDGKNGQKWGTAGALTVDFSNKNFISLTKEITPAILRIGGSPEDSIIYNISGSCLNINASLPGYGCSEAYNNYGCLNETRWTEINEFAYKTNLTLVFGLNACYGRPSHNESMNFTNIEQLFNYTVNKMNKTIINNLYAFEYGNSEGQQHGSTQKSLIGVKAYSNDFYNLYNLIQKYFISNKLNVYAIADDDNLKTDFNKNFSKQFLNNLESIAMNNNLKTSDILHRFTYHNYPNCGYPGSNQTVFSLECLQEIDQMANYTATFTKQYGIDAWLGEGSEHSGGGTPNVSNTMVDNFYYLYQLSNIILNGVQGTLRSDLIGGDYELIDHETFLPNPDYWIIWLWHQFIGNKLFNLSITPNDNVRAYAFNGKSNNNQIVLALINFDLQNAANFSITVNNGMKYNSNEYYLQPSYSNDLQSRIIFVNGVEMCYNGNFPILEPVKGNGVNVMLEPARIAFIVLTPQ